MPEEIDRRWVAEAIEKLNADTVRTSDTHLIPLPLAALRDMGIDIYLKDESTLPSGSLKHRLARSLFLYGLCNGTIGPRTPIVEASSGSTAISEAYFAQVLGLRFIAVVPASTAPEKLREIEFYGGEVQPVEAAEIYREAEELAARLGGHYMDQFCNAERATDWRGNNNIAESLHQQMRKERHPNPTWIVVGAGTGGTSATIGRYARYVPALAETRVAVVDPENSVFAEYYETRDRDTGSPRASRIEGIGRPRVEPSFIPDVVDRVMRVPDAASIAGIQWLRRLMGRRFGGSTGTNIWGVAALADELRRQGREGSIVSLICDPGARYHDTYFNQDWLDAQGIDTGPFAEALGRFEAEGVLPEVSSI